jgi:S-DNA-T family DNA segregation ATPase FtsK/SpoIIIE
MGDAPPRILEGRVVDEPSRPVPLRPVHAVKVIATHQRTRAAAAHVAYVGIGASVVVKRLWESRSTARYERYIRSAEAAGDREAALQWDQQRTKFLKDRHQRRTAMVELPIKLARELPKIAIGVLGVLVAIGILLAIATKHIAEVSEPVKVTARIAEWVAIAFSVTWGPFLLGAPWIVLAALYWTGRRYANAAMTGWTVADKADEDTGIIITADTIVLALQHLDRIAALKKAFRDGWTPTFHTLPVRDGSGYQAVFSLPLGVTAGMIADQRPVLARNVHRAEVEVWPSDAEKAGLGPPGTASVWIADSGVLSKMAPEYPLMHDGTADVFAGVPGGVSPRGEEIAIPVVENNFVAGGQMGQGKSNSCRVVMLGCALDPLAELNVFVFANNGDFDAYAPRLAVYVKGVEDDALSAAVARLHELYAEVARREGRLAELGAKKLTRSLAERYDDMHPIIALFSECHELFGHPEYGPAATELATKTIKRARKTGVVLGFDTQSSRKEAIPPKLVELVSVNICFYVKTWRSNDGFLGDGSFAAGIRATELRPGRDRGTSVITGVSDAQFELMRWYFVEVNDDTGYDAATDIIARAVAQVAPGTPVEGGRPVPVIEMRDLLDDLDAVLDGERLKLRDVVGLLRGLAPAWAYYQRMTAKQLGTDLASEGIRVINSSGTPYLDPADLRAVIMRRSTEDLDEEVPPWS